MSFLSRCNILKVLEFQLYNTRQYTRWSHRRPKRVLTPEEFDKLEAQYQGNKVVTSNTENQNVLQKESTTVFKERASEQKKSWIPKNIKREKPVETLINLSELDEKKSTLLPTKKNFSSKRKEPIYKTKKDVDSESHDMLETVIDSDGNFVYTKLPNKDSQLSQVLVTVKSHNIQKKKDLTLLEGKRLIKEALESNCRLTSLIFSRKSDLEYLKPFLPKSGAKLYKIPYREIQMWSDLSTAPGIMGIFKIPDVEKFQPPTDSLELIVVCDNVREPGNLGAILRTAAGVGVQSVLLTKGCVDLWDTKVLRSACGAHFRLQIHRKMDWVDIKDHLKNLNSSILVADNKTATDIVHESSTNLEDAIIKLPLLPYYSVNFAELGTLILIIGGETEGISGDSYRFAAENCGVRLNIPLNNSIDSLNTGTSLGVILFEIKRQLLLSKHKKEQIINSCY